MNRALKSKLMDIPFQTGVESKSLTTELMLVSKKDREAKMTMEDLNQKLAYFYNNGGPVMEKKEGVMVKTRFSRPTPKNNQARVNSGGDTVTLLTPEGSKSVSVDYLNEKLIYFYGHGGPVMDI